MNANVLHRWLKASSQFRLPICSGAVSGATAVDTDGQDMPLFIAVPLHTKPTEPVEREIRVEVRKGDLIMTVTWPISVSSDFAHWSTAILK